MSTITKTPIIIAVLAIASLFVAGPVSTSMDELNVYANKNFIVFSLKSQISKVHRNNDLNVYDN